MKENKLKIIEDALNSVRPFLQKDGGDVELIDIDENNKVSLKLLGACKTCNISHFTMKVGIEEAIKRVLPEVSEVVAI